MTAFVDETLQIISQRPPEEQQELLTGLLRIIRQATKEPRIRQTPGVVGGRPRVRDMRIPVSLIIRWYQLGWTDERMLEGYPGMEIEDLVAVRDYYQKNKSEIDADIEAEENA